MIPSTFMERRGRELALEREVAELRAKLAAQTSLVRELELEADQHQADAVLLQELLVARAVLEDETAPSRTRPPETLTYRRDVRLPGGGVVKVAHEDRRWWADTVGLDARELNRDAG